MSALAYLRGGLSVIPCSPRSKRPRLSAWKPYQQRPPTPWEVARWFGPWSRSAVAIVTGAVSGALTVLDFDAPALFAPWVEQVQQQAPSLLSTLPVVQTPSGGYHVYLRSTGDLRGNQKLAVDPARPGGKYTLIETRGEGGYVLAPPSTGYTLLHGDLTAIPVVDGTAYALLLNAARRFSRESVTPRRAIRAHPARSRDGSRPGDDYNRRGDVVPILERHGWRCVRQRGAASYWRRPGKRLGHSATYNYCSTRFFYVFTTNAPPFEPERAYSPFAVFALLEHGGDYRAAAQRLRRLGYGAQSTRGAG